MIAPLTLGALLLSGSASLGSPVPVSPGLGSPSLDPRSPMWPRSPLPPIPRSPLPENPSFMVSRELLPRDDSGISRCGSHLTPERHAAVEMHFKKHRKPALVHAKTAAEPINVYFHVIYANETLEGGYVPDSQLQAQVDTLNKAYSATPLTFKLANITRTQNEDWFSNVGPEESQQQDMKEQLRLGEAKDLNVYTVGFKQGSGKGLLGYSTFPSDYEGNPQDDGVVMQFATLPGGTMPNYNLGATLTHETGHWAGLYHTFQGGCDAPGDSVDDTPPEASAASGCPVKRKTCQNSSGFDPVTNFMDYTYDSCMTGFTAGQGQRIADQMRTYRGVNL